MIRRIKIVSDTNSELFLRYVRDTIRSFQEKGLEVEIQYSSSGISGGLHPTEYSALIIGREKLVKGD